MIKNIIFDFGGVIYNIDHGLSQKAFEDLGAINFKQLYGHQVQTGLFERLERGEIQAQDFRNSLQEILPVNITNQQIDDAWNALLIGFDKRKLELLKAIGKNYRIFLLSNTNIIHYNRFIAELNIYTDFRSLFEDVWLSHEKKMRKPEKEFYLKLMEKHLLLAKETLFIDDLDINIESAKKLGIQTYYLNNGQSMLDLFYNNKLII